MVSVADLPDEAREFLELTNDHVVGGRFITPVFDDYSVKTSKRRAAFTLQDWASADAIHLNSSSKLSQTIKAPTSKPVNRVVMLDFDIYGKPNSPDPKDAPTPQGVINNLKVAGAPLPQCWMPSGTPGNFHMFWVYRTPVPRSMHGLREAARSHGADERYTNSTMRNPIKATLDPDRECHWWTEWTDESPLLDDISQIVLGEDIKEPSTPSESKVRKGSKSTYGRFTFNLTSRKLQELMRTSSDGDGRWFMLRSYFTQKLWEVHTREGRTLTTQEVETTLKQGNKLFREPMETRRAMEAKKYWTPSRQRAYVRRQTRAWQNNLHAKQAHEEAVEKFRQAMNYRDYLVRVSQGEEVMTAEEQELDAQFKGRRISNYGVPTFRWQAWMMQMEESETVNPTTGEVSTVPPDIVLKNLISNGKKRGYSLEPAPAPEEEVLRPTFSSHNPGMYQTLTGRVFYHTVEGCNREHVPKETRHSPIMRC